MKICREKLNLTQENLVSELYNHDDVFQGLDTNTFSRWERGTTKPPISKQTKILEYFFSKFSCYFPFLEMDDLEVVEKKFCSTRIKKLLGKHSKLVMNFPYLHANDSDFIINSASKSTHIEIALHTAINIVNDMYGDDTFYTKERLKELAFHSSNLFLICEYNQQYLGHLFLVRLKTAVYSKIINLEMNYQDIDIDDIASPQESGSYFSLGMFAMNDKALSLLFIRFYANLIVNQENISQAGTLLSKDDALNMVTNVNLKRVGSKGSLIAYNGNLKEIFLNEQIIKILFS